MYSPPGADDAPPKPSRQHQTTEATVPESGIAPVSTYIIAQSPEVLAQLMKENQERGVCPSVYTTPASAFNTLAVQFQDEEKILTTASASDLPFFNPTLSTPQPEPQSLEIQSEASLDSITSTDTISSMISNLSITEPPHNQSSIPSNKYPLQPARMIKEMQNVQNLYAVSSKVVSSVTTELYSSVQKSCGASSMPDIYGPVANFPQSSTIMGAFTQLTTSAMSDSSGPVSLNYSEAPQNNDNQSTQISQSVHSHVSQIKASYYPESVSCSHVKEPHDQLIFSSKPGLGAECLYGPVMKFRPQNPGNDLRHSANQFHEPRPQFIHYKEESSQSLSQGSKLTHQECREENQAQNLGAEGSNSQPVKFQLQGWAGGLVHSEDNKLNKFNEGYLGGSVVSSLASEPALSSYGLIEEAQHAQV